MPLFGGRRRDVQLLERDGHEIRVVLQEAPIDAAYGAGIQISADMPGCPGLTLTARPGSYFIAAGRQDAITGHPGFDDRYIVKTDDETMMRLWLGEAELDAILSTYSPTASSPFEISIGDGQIVFRASANYSTAFYSDDPWATPQPRPQVERQDHAITAAAFLAGRGARVAAAWRLRAAELGGSLRGELWTWRDDFAVVIPGEGAETRIDFPFDVEWSRQRGPRTRAWTRRYQPEAPVAALSRPDLPRKTRASAALDGLDRDGDELGPLVGAISPPHQPVPRHLADIVITAGVDWIVIDETTIATGWQRVVDDVATLRAALALIDALTAWIAPSSVADGPYR